MLEQIRTIYDGVVTLDPVIGFAGNHPYLAITLALAAIGVSGAVGGYIGAGGADLLREYLKDRKKKRK